MPGRWEATQAGTPGRTVKRPLGRFTLLGLVKTLPGSLRASHIVRSSLQPALGVPIPLLPPCGYGRKLC